MLFTRAAHNSHMFHTRNAHTCILRLTGTGGTCIDASPFGGGDLGEISRDSSAAEPRPRTTKELGHLGPMQFYQSANLPSLTEYPGKFNAGEETCEHLARVTCLGSR